MRLVMDKVHYILCFLIELLVSDFTRDSILSFTKNST